MLVDDWYAIAYPMPLPLAKTENGRILLNTVIIPMAKPKPNVEQRSLADLMTALDPDNPRIHKGDIPSLAIRLLHYDWQKLPTLNKRNKLLAGGHGRVMACEYLVQKNKEWFEDEWERFVDSHKQKLTEQEFITARLRFAPKYWLQIPVLIVDLSDKDHKITLMALNKAKGKDDEAKVAKLLSRMNELNAEAAGWGDQGERDRFLSKFGLLKAKIVESTQRQEAEENTPVFANAEAIATEVKERIQFSDVAIAQDEVEYEDEDESEEFEPEEEPDVETGGSNHNPEPPKSNQVVYPLNVSLGANQAKKYEALKEKLKLKNDISVMLKYHPAFAAPNGSK